MNGILFSTVTLILLLQDCGVLGSTGAWLKEATTQTPNLFRVNAQDSHEDYGYYDILSDNEEIEEDLPMEELLPDEVAHLQLAPVVHNVPRDHNVPVDYNVPLEKPEPELKGGKSRERSASKEAFSRENTFKQGKCYFWIYKRVYIAKQWKKRKVNTNNI